MDDTLSVNANLAENESISENKSVISEIKVDKQANIGQKDAEFDLERLNLMDGDLEQKDELNKKLTKVKRDLSVKIPVSYVDTAGFAPVFNTQIGSAKRSVKSFLFGSRLSKKASNASKIKDTEKAAIKARAREKENARKGRRKQPVSIEEFLAISTSSFAMTTDEEFVAAARTLEKIAEQTEEMRTEMRDHIEADQSISAETKEAIKKKLMDLTRLNGYYTARKKLITNQYYMTHYNSEMTYLSKRIPKKKEAAENGKNLRGEMLRLRRAQEEVSNLILDVELNSYLVNNGMELNKESKKEFFKVYDKKLSEKEQLSMYNTIATRSKYAEPSTCFGMGYVLQFINWMWGGKRKTDYGESDYEKSMQKYDLLPEKIRNYKKNDVINRPKRGVEPDIPLNKYMDDPFKDALVKIQRKAPQPDEFDDEDYTGAYEALKKWNTIRGIVNLDTTRMEMACSDRFLKASRRWLDAHPNAQNSAYMTEKLKYQFLTQVTEEIDKNLYGSMGRITDREQFEKFKDMPVIHEDNTYGKNVEESNVKDIPLFLHTPHINDVKQAFVGDCWFQSGIQAAVEQNPDAIKNMFCDLKDGTVVVRLYQRRTRQGEGFGSSYFASNFKSDFVTVPVYVRLRKDFEEGNASANDCLWVQLLERALAASGIQANFLSQVKDGKLTNVASEITGGDPVNTMSIITGEIAGRVQVREDKGFSIPKPKNMSMKYFFLLNGVPREMKRKIIHSLDLEEKKKTKITLDMLINFAKKAQEEHKKQITLCKSEVGKLTEELAQIKQAHPEELKDLGNISELDDKLLTALGEDYADQDMEERIRRNVATLEEEKTPDYTPSDLLETEGATGAVISMCKMIRAAIKKNDPEKIKATTKELEQKVTGLYSTMTAKKLDRAAMLSETKKRLFKGGDNEIRAVRNGCRHLTLDLQYGTENYTQPQVESLMRLRRYLKREKAIAVCFGMHSMTVLDTQYKDGHWFVLIRDPFNLYNRSYTKKNGKLECSKSEGFFRVFNMHLYERKRHLTDRGQESNMRAGFRGLTWISFEDFYKEASHYVAKILK